MKITPVSADLLIKLAMAGLAVGAVLYLVNRGTNAASGALQSLADLPGRVWDSVTGVAEDIIAAPGKVADAVILSTQEAGQGWQYQYQEQTPAMQGATGRKYNGPLISNDGMDFSPFGGLSG